MTPPFKVLVIDDSEVARIAISKVVQAAGFVVVELATPLGATREVIRNQISVVVIDVNMPTIQGDKLARLFRSNTRCKNVRIVLISSAKAEEMQRLMDECQADGYVQKSEMSEKLPRLLRRLAAMPPRNAP